MDKELLIENIVRCCKAMDEPPTKACANAGVGKSFISHIRDGQVPSVAKVADLAAYLGVTTSDLVGDARDGPVALSPLDAEMLDAVRGLDDDAKRAILTMAKRMR